jgi:hypothetical protein
LGFQTTEFLPLVASMQVRQSATPLQIVRRENFATGPDVAVQDSNSYLFNVPLPNRVTEGDLALPLLRPGLEADARFQCETGFSHLCKASSLFVALAG